MNATKPAPAPVTKPAPKPARKRRRSGGKIPYVPTHEMSWERLMSE